MPRLPRINLEGALHYVTSKGLQDGKIFIDKGDYLMYLELLAKYKNQHKFKLFSYCLQGERIQLLIETGGDATISEVMHDLTSLYTKYYNGRYGKRGHLFEARFKSMLVEKAQYLLALSRQIHLAGGNPKEYPYSSFHFYVSSPPAGGGSAYGGNALTEKLNMSEEVQEVKNFLVNKDNPDAYESYCLQADEKEIEDLAKSLGRGSVLGSEEFRRAVEKKVEEHAESQAAKNVDEGTNKLSLIVYVIAGAAVLVLTSASIYLYFSKQDVEKKYRTAVQLKEAEFIEKTKFQNQSPIVPSELEGTEWEVEILGFPSGRPEDKLKDKIRFKDGSFFSQVFEAPFDAAQGKQGFQPTRYFLIPQGKGMASWQCAQANPSGETIRWQGDWRGGAMKGSLVSGGQTFSFFSTGWSYFRETEKEGTGANEKTA